jgi:hypothetical protein
MGQLIQAPVLAVNRNEINFFLWVNPQRHLVRQRMTARKFQSDKDGSVAVSVKPVPRPSPAPDASARRPYLSRRPS